MFERAFGNVDGFRLDLLQHGRGSVAAAVLAIAFTERLSDYSKAVLRDVYMGFSEEAVRGDFVVEIRQRKRGKRKTSEAPDSKDTDESIATMVGFLTDAFGKKEAAVAAVADMWKVSRASIFRSLKRNAERLSHKSE